MSYPGEIVLTLPIPPSVNRYWRYSPRNGRVFVTDEAKAYKSQIRYTTRCPLLTGPVCLNLTVYRPAKRGDLDNYLKIMLDALQGVLYENDDQIAEIHAYRDNDPANPRVILTAWESEER